MAELVDAPHSKCGAQKAWGFDSLYPHHYRRWLAQMTVPSGLVQKVHFEDFGGPEFERLVFAYHLRAGWTDVAWYGQTGSDQGRDIIGTESIDGEPARRTVIQCVNRNAITQKKAEDDMDAAFIAPTGKPDAFKFVVRGAVSATRRDAINKAARRIGVNNIIVWSGAEFEENLRLRSEDLLRRFCAGEAFPDKADEIRRFVDDFVTLTDSDILTIMAAVFDRPAFHTPFHLESSIPAFQRAIEDTIAALNTGVWRTREGSEIRRIPSLHHLRDPRAKAKVVQTVQLIDNLRRHFVSGLRDGKIKHCGCGQEDCPVFMLQPGVATELDHMRSRALDAFRSAHPSFDVSIG
jgi:hypothetical protein